MRDTHFYKFTITVQLNEFRKSVEEGIVYSTKGYADALSKAIARFVSDESDLISVDSLYPIKSLTDVIDMYDLTQVIKDYEGRQ